MTSNEAFTINLEWKGVPMDSTFGNLRLDSIMIKMIFNRSFSEWKLLDLEISKAVVAGANILDSGMQVWLMLIRHTLSSGAQKIGVCSPIQ